MRKPLIISSLLLTMIISSFAVIAQADNGAVAGGENDPLVSLSYVTQVLQPQIEASILSKISGTTIDPSTVISGTGTPANTASGGVNIEYVVVTLKKDQLLMPKSSCEIIVRPGSSAVIVAPVKDNGLIDTTAGEELLNGKSTPINHNLIIPRADGRAIKVTSNVAYVMVRGEYEVVG